MDVPFSNEFLMPCCVGCSADDDYDDFDKKNKNGQNSFFWTKMAV